MLPVAAEYCSGYRTRMKKVTTASANSDPAASLHGWLSVHAGADPDGDHLVAALTARERWLAPDKVHESGAARVLAVCKALVELSEAERWAVTESSVRRLNHFANACRAFLDEHSDVPKAAAARQDGYKAISKMYGPSTFQAANAFAFGPPEVFERMESCCRDLRKYADDAIAITHYEPRRGRPEQPGLAAAAKQLRLAEFTYAEIAKLLPDGI